MDQNADKARNTYVDIVKAIGIISIVVGHSCYGVRLPFAGVSLGRFVYTYHILVFFFTAGYCFKISYTEDIERFIGKRFFSTGKLFFIYNAIFVLLHNVFLNMHLLDESTNVFYDLSDIIRNIISGVLFIQTEQLLGAMWFLPMFLLGLIFFCLAVCLVRHFDVFGIEAAVVGLFVVLALYVNEAGIVWSYQLQTSLLGVPVIFAGYFYKIHAEKLQKYVSIVGAGGSAAVLLYILSLNIGSIELSVNSIINPFIFYPVTFLGIYFCLGFAKLIDKISLFRKIFSVIGKNSFHIMALHFLAFKLLDLLFAITHRQMDITGVSKFTHADYGMTFEYVLAGIIFPLGIIFLLTKFKKAMKGFIR